MTIRYNKPYATGDELGNIQDAHDRAWLSGDGEYTRRCSEWLQQQTGSHRVMLTQSCTAALEMSALLADIRPGDEVIMPSYTFVSTANAFVLRGGVPVFVDIRADTQNIDENLIEAAITERTRAIVPVHYAGVACEMNAIMRLADAHGLDVIEDAAQGVMADYHGRALGSIGGLGTFSFHESKNIISGEGGALLVNQAAWEERAEIMREKGTNRSRFLRGQVDKYTWVDIGSSYLPSEVTAAYLFAQLSHAADITARRLAIWQRYYEALVDDADPDLYRLPAIPEGCNHNAHIFYLKFPRAGLRDSVMQDLAALGIAAVTHYVPLHSSPAGERYGRVSGSMQRTDETADTLLRLPLWPGLPDSDQQRVIDAVRSSLGL